MLNDGQNVEFGKGHAGEGGNRLAQFLVCDALRTVGIDLVEHLSDVEIIQRIEKRTEWVLAIRCFVVLDGLLFIKNIGFVVFLKIVVIISLFVAGGISIDDSNVFLLVEGWFFVVFLVFDVFVITLTLNFFSLNFILLLGLNLFVLSRGLSGKFDGLVHKGLSGLGEFLLVQVSIFVFIERSRKLQERGSIVNVVLVHDTLQDGFCVLHGTFRKDSFEFCQIDGSIAVFIDGFHQSVHFRRWQCSQIQGQQTFLQFLGIDDVVIVGVKASKNVLG